MKQLPYLLVVCSIVFMTLASFLFVRLSNKQSGVQSLKSPYDRSDQKMQNSIVVDSDNWAHITGEITQEIKRSDDKHYLSITTDIQGESKNLILPFKSDFVSVQLVKGGEINPQKREWSMQKIEDVQKYIQNGTQVTVDIEPIPGNKLSLETIESATITRITIPISE